MDLGYGVKEAEMYFINDNGALVFKTKGETVRIEAWGENALRVRATMFPKFTGHDWALTEKPSVTKGDVKIGKPAEWCGDGTNPDWHEVGEITNGRIKATVNFVGIISFYRDNKLILREDFHCYGGTLSKESPCLKTVNREWKGVIGGSEYSLDLRFESNDGEKIFGMGQYQQPYLDLKGCTLELAQRNSQASVPFLISSLGYGMLWNNPAVGEVTFGKNITRWVARATKEMDYWITADEDPKKIEANYTSVTGHAPMFPESLMGL